MSGDTKTGHQQNSSGTQLPELRRSPGRVMSWTRLLSPERERKRAGAVSSPEGHRNSFDMDYDRIVYSSSLRRLQDKAQVFPLQENDFTRTRLTHSLEASAIGRSLGNKVGRWLEERDQEYRLFHAGKLSTLLQVAGLVHDLGNPPFGHYGEDVIRQWFLQSGVAPALSGAERSDFTLYDGNAQTIRILSRLQFLKDRHGINFCYGTLATLLKYPWDSADPRAGERGKFGFFQSEKELCCTVMEATGIIGRHPATYLLEAADDIAYLFADLEDAVKKGHVPWPRVCGQLMADSDLWNGFEGQHQDLQKELDRLGKSGLPYEEMDQVSVQHFKIIGQVMCINAVFDEFTTAYEDIMAGCYSRKALLDAPPIKTFAGRVRDLCIKYAYSNSEVLTLEIIAKSVMTTILKSFVPAILDDRYDDPRTESGKICRLISKNFEYVQKLDNDSVYRPEARLSCYQRVQLVIDFISGMTDSYALNLHKKFLGMILP